MCIALAMAGEGVGQVSSADLQRRHRQMKAEQERRAAEMKRLHEQRLKQVPAQGSRPRSPQSAPGLSAARAQERPVPAFDPSAAPPPIVCLAQYVTAARRANSMEEILKYLPLAEQRSLKEYQATYDPQEAAKSRERLRRMDPKLDEGSLAHLTNPPYVNGLIHHRQVAGGILDVLSVDVEGRKAVIEVSTTVGGRVNGVEYPYGRAKIEMLGEEGFWRIASYNDSSVVYLHPPQK
jgi:hypothetical protein